MEILDQIWAFLMGIFGDLDGMLEELVNFDQLALNFYNDIIMPLPEWIKILGTLGLAVVFIFGIFAIAKKMMKLLIFVVVILAILVLARILMS
ncbi:hypothetical protein N7603_08015 [Acholeplasma vituli]|uniref:Uncharacterized protein n=1 Tax=Paracholeplasma vituli TaxID=69473 RepID=A0ABT2PXY1_9MOLU|nr:hypothetical protein [Paracholeplasma vituli]MCU0105603.1 hypothetical protein [Paracholeplasma vituli]